jgi:adenosylhomocysteinase
MIELPVATQILDEVRDAARGIQLPGLLVIQHVLRDTERFLQLLLERGWQVRMLIGIPYSCDASAAERLASLTDVRVPAFEDFQRVVDDMLTNELRRGPAERFILQEVGGYCATLLGNGSPVDVSGCAGAIEETRRGLWRYQAQQGLKVPVLEIAGSRLKEIEAIHVGEAVARAIATDLAVLGKSLPGLTAGVIGFGSIGSAVAHSLHARGAAVACFDLSAIRQIESAARGFRMIDLRRLLAESDLVVGATGTGAFSANEIPLLKDGAILASASSGRREFPLDALAGAARGCGRIGESVTRLELSGGATIHLIKDGFPANFRLTSLPLPIADLLFAELALCLGRLVLSSPPPGLHSLDLAEEERAASLWCNAYGLSADPIQSRP